MIDILTLSQNEEVVLDTTNNTVTIVLLTSATVEIRNQNDVLYGTLQNQYEIYTLAINTGYYTAKCTSSSDAKIMIVRQFIY